MSIADPGIRSTLQFWFTMGIIIPYQVIKAAIECAPEIRNMIMDLVANDNSPTQHEGNGHPELMEDVEMMIESTEIDRNLDRIVVDDEELFSDDMTSTLLNSLMDDQDDDIPRAPYVDEVQDEVEELEKWMYFSLLFGMFAN